MRERNWSSSESPIRVRLTGVESNGNNAFASGDRGVLIQRKSRDNWVSVFDNGPRGNGNNILDLSITDDGERVWYCGDSGAFGYYDRAAGDVESQYAPKDYTSGFVTIEVTGRSGREDVFAANNSGTVLHASANGDAVTVRHNTTPSNASKATEIVGYRSEHYMSTVDGDIFYSESDDSWKQMTLAQEPVQALSSGDTGVAAVVDSGTLYRDVSPADGVEPRKIDLGVRGMEELAVRGKTFVAVGRDGRIALLDAAGGVAYPDPSPGVTFYGADVLDDGTVLALGSRGKILEGTL